MDGWPHQGGSCRRLQGPGSSCSTGQPSASPARTTQRSQETHYGRHSEKCLPPSLPRALAPRPLPGLALTLEATEAPSDTCTAHAETCVRVGGAHTDGAPARLPPGPAPGWVLAVDTGLKPTCSPPTETRTPEAWAGKLDGRLPPRLCKGPEASGDAWRAPWGIGAEHEGRQPGPQSPGSSACFTGVCQLPSGVGLSACEQDWPEACLTGPLGSWWRPDRALSQSCPGPLWPLPTTALPLTLGLALALTA